MTPETPADAACTCGHSRIEHYRDKPGTGGSDLFRCLHWDLGPGRRSDMEASTRRVRCSCPGEAS